MSAMFIYWVSVRWHSAIHRIGTIRFIVVPANGVVSVKCVGKHILLVLCICLNCICCLWVTHTQRETFVVTEREWRAMLRCRREFVAMMSEVIYDRQFLFIRSFIYSMCIIIIIKSGIRVYGVDLLSKLRSYSKTSKLIKFSFYCVRLVGSLWYGRVIQ